MVGARLKVDWHIWREGNHSRKNLNRRSTEAQNWSTNDVGSADLNSKWPQRRPATSGEMIALQAAASTVRAVDWKAHRLRRELGDMHRG